MYAYAIVRYHIGKSISWSEWYFVLNKAFAWCGFVLISLSLLKSSRLELINTNRRQLGVSGFLFTILHITGTYFLLSPNLYPKFYENNLISNQGWVYISIGLIAALIFLILFIASIKGLPNEHPVFRLGKYGIAIVTLHPLLIGMSGWINPLSWPLFMPPITLLAVIGVGVVFFIRKRDKLKS